MRRRWPAALSSLAVVAAGLSAAVLAGGGGPASANPTGAPPQVFVGGGTSSSGPYDQFDLSALQAGKALPVASGSLGAQIGAIAINATATKVVYGVYATPGAVNPEFAVEDVASHSVATVGTGFNPLGIAADPTDPGTAYAVEYTGNGGRVDTVGISPPTDTPLPSGGTGRVLVPSAIAISPDGSTIFVAGGTGGSSGNADLTAISVANPGGAQTPFLSGHSGSIVDLAIAPGGNALYAVSAGTSAASGALDDWVFALPLPLLASAKPLWARQLPTGNSQLQVPTAVTVSPDGATVYVAGVVSTVGSPSAVQAFAASSGTPGASQLVNDIPSGDGFGGVVSEAVSPDGTTLVVAGTDGSNLSHVDTLPLPSLSTVTANSIGTGFGRLAGPQEFAITPDQAPVAAFTAVPGVAGSATTFDANASTVAYGAVNSFAWNFGDGNTATTGSATASHVYGNVGTYTVTLTETDSAGTSVPPAVFLTGYAVNGPGQTPFRRADNSARTSRIVVVTAVPTSTPTTVVTVPGTPALVLNPIVGPPGTLVTVTGSGFPANTPITVSWSVSSGSVVITSDAHGNLPPTILPVLVPDVLGPRNAVAATSPPAQAAFLVVPSTAEPGGSSGSYLFRSEGP